MRIVRAFDYLGHRVLVEQQHRARGEMWMVFVDHLAVGGRGREPEAMALAYAHVDQLVEDAKVLPGLEALKSMRMAVTGPGFNPELDDVGSRVWVEHRGQWWRGAVLKVKRTRLEVGFTMDGETVRRKTVGPADVVRA